MNLQGVSANKLHQPLDARSMDKIVKLQLVVEKLLSILRENTSLKLALSYNTTQGCALVLFVSQNTGWCSPMAVCVTQSWHGAASRS